MKNYLTPLNTKLSNESSIIIATVVNFLEKNTRAESLFNPGVLEDFSKSIHHKHGFKKIIGNMRIDVSPSVRVNYSYDNTYDSTAIYYQYTENLLKLHRLIGANDSIKNTDPPFLSNNVQSEDSGENLDCKYFLGEDSYDSFINQAENELYTKNLINMPGIINKGNQNNILKNFKRTMYDSPWGGPRTNVNPAVEYVMQAPYIGKSITYLLLLSIYNYINSITIPNYTEIISECSLRTQDIGNNPYAWTPNSSYLNNFRNSSNNLYSDVMEGFGSNIFENDTENEDLIPRNLRTIFFLRIPYASIRTIKNFDAYVSEGQIVNMNPCTAPNSNIQSKIKYTR
jgi:hypothetical protein